MDSRPVPRNDEWALGTGQVYVDARKGEERERITLSFFSLAEKKAAIFLRFGNKIFLVCR